MEGAHEGSDIATTSDVVCAMVSTVLGGALGAVIFNLWMQGQVTVTLVPAVAIHWPEGTLVWALVAVGVGAAVTNGIGFGALSLWRQSRTVQYRSISVEADELGARGATRRRESSSAEGPHHLV